MLSRSFLVQICSTAVFAVLQLLSISFLSRLIAPIEFGYVATASVAAFIGVALSDIGFGSSIVRKRKLDEHFTNLVLTLAIAVFAIVCVGILASVALIWKDIKIIQLAALFSASAFFMAVAGVVKGILQRERSFWQLFQINAGAYLCGMIILAIPLAYSGAGAFSVAVGQFVYGFLTLVLAVHMTKIRFKPVFNRRFMRPLLGFGGYVALGRTIDILLTEGDKLFMAAFAGFEKVGIFERLSRIGLIIGGHTTFIVDSVLYPQLCRDLQKSKSEVAGRIFVVISTLASFSLLMATVLGFPLIYLILGPKFVTYLPLLPVLLLSAYLRLQARPFEVFLRARGKPHAIVLAKLCPALMLIASLFFVADRSLVVWSWCFAVTHLLVLLTQGAVAVRFGLPMTTFGLIAGFHCPLTIGLMLWLGGVVSDHSDWMRTSVTVAGVVLTTGVLALSCKPISGVGWHDLVKAIPWKTR